MHRDRKQTGDDRGSGVSGEMEGIGRGVGGRGYGIRSSFFRYKTNSTTDCGDSSTALRTH